MNHYRYDIWEILNLLPLGIALYNEKERIFYFKNKFWNDNINNREVNLSAAEEKIGDKLFKITRIRYADNVVIISAFDITETISDIVIRSKYEAMGSMASFIAHEIKNPLSALRNYTDMLKRADEDDLNVYIDKIISCANDMDNIVSNILILVREGEGDIIMERVNVEAVLHDVLTELEKTSMLKDCRIVKKFNCENVFTRGNRFLLKRIFYNILVNAEESLEDDRKKEINITTYNEERKINIEISDTGCGIPKESLENIFLPFFTTKPKGTGIGLAVVKKILKLHNGEITVKSKIGEGTVFKIILPQ